MKTVCVCNLIIFLCMNLDFKFLRIDCVSFRCLSFNYTISTKRQDQTCAYCTVGIGSQRENHLSRFIERSIYQNIFGGTVDNVEFRSGEGSVTLRCCITSVMVGFSKVESALLNQVGNRCCGEINDLTVCCDLKVDTLSTVLITSRRGNLFDGVFTSLKDCTDLGYSVRICSNSCYLCTRIIGAAFNILPS